MTYLVAGDCHQNINWIKSIINRENPDHIYLLGDFFDTHETQFNNQKSVIETCKFLKENLHSPKFTILFGNHDLSYHFTKNPYLRCGGFDESKFKLINSILTPKDWVLFKFYAWHNDYLLTHAGLTKQFVKFEPNKENVNKFLKKSEIAARLALEQIGKHWFVGAGHIRGGPERTGGLTWCDWDEFMSLKNLNGEETVPQILGHTFGILPKQKGKSYCIDCNQNHYIIFEDDKLEIKKYRN